MSWLEAALAEKDWKKADAIVQHIFIREQSQAVTERKAREEAAMNNSIPQVSTIDTTASTWIECQDESSGATYYYNQATGETSWSKPSTASTWEAMLGNDGKLTTTTQ